MLREEQIERWKQLRDEMFSNEEFMKLREKDNNQRRTAIQEMNKYLAMYLSGNIDNQAFREIFQQKTAREWVSFGLKGFSGAMFLNMLVNNLPNQVEVAQQLKTTLPAPTNLDDAHHRLSNFVSYIKNLLSSGVVAKQKIHAAHAPFFFSAWWHVQNTEEWPIYYGSARTALAADEIYTPLNNQPVDDYFTFREAFLNLRKILELTTWEMEHLCVWYEKSSVHITLPIEPVEVISPSITPIEKIQTPPRGLEDEEKVHSQIQWLLARIGQKFGYKVWIAANDRKRTWNGEALGKYSVANLPPLNGVSPKSQRMIELIDVVWLSNSRVVAAFEVESTTSIYSGLLRMFDLALALEGFNLSLFIAVPSVRVEHVKGELSRLTFQRLGLHERCRFFTFEKLIEEAEAMMSYATDVKAINKISQQVSGIDDEGF